MERTKENYIIIYAEDFDTDIWEDYCRTCGVDTDSICIKIHFNDEDVKWK